MTVRSCSGCGATVQLPSEVISTLCAFCESPLVEASSEAEPIDGVAPFLVDRDAAAEALSHFLARSLFAPEAVRRAATPRELRPVFVPFYVYDAVAHTEYQAQIGVYWYRTETYTTTDSEGKTVTKTRRVRETEWHPLQGSHVSQWLDHLVSASRGLGEAEANALEPFDLGRALPWSPALVAGIEAERPTVDHSAASQTASREIAELAGARIGSSHLPGDTHRELRWSTRCDLGEVRLVLLPVWVAVLCTPRDETIRLLVNGQTTEVVGRVPTSVPKVLGAVAAVVLLLAGLVLLFGLIGGTW